MAKLYTYIHIYKEQYIILKPSLGMFLKIGFEKKKTLLGEKLKFLAFEKSIFGPIFNLIEVLFLLKNTYLSQKCFFFFKSNTSKP